MALVNQTLKLEITPGGVPPKLHVTEYDENMQIVAQLFQRGQYYEIPSGTTAKVEGTLAGHPFSADATVDGSNVTFELTKGMTAYAGRAWTKIKLTKDSKPVSTCGFWLDCDRSGVEAGDVIHDSGFQEQINQGVFAWLDGHEPFFTLPEGGEDGETLVSDGQGGAYWSQPRGSGMTDEFVTAFSTFLDHLSGVFDDQNGQTYIDNLKNAMQGSSGSDTIFANGVLTILQTATSISASQSGSVLTLS